MKDYSIFIQWLQAHPPFAGYQRDHSSISVRGQHTEMNPTLFFNRITCVLNTSSEMVQFMSDELASQPPSLS